jgi:hypothetical protein
MPLTPRGASSNTLCTNRGKRCAPAPSGHIRGKATGKLLQIATHGATGITTAEQQGHRLCPNPIRRSDDLVHRHVRTEIQGYGAGASQQDFYHQQTDGMLLPRQRRHKNPGIPEWPSDKIVRRGNWSVLAVALERSGLRRFSPWLRGLLIVNAFGCSKG